MARRKWSPPMARPTARQRVVELCKDALILALTCSAVLLALQTPMFSQMQDWMAEPAEPVSTVDQPRYEAVAPYLVSVRNGMGLYGVSYDENLVGRAFDRISYLLGEGFATAGTAESMTRRQFQELMEAPGLYCAFQGTPPMSVLSDWLGSGQDISGQAEALLLAWDGTEVWLCWRTGNVYRHARTQVVYEGHLEEVLGEFSPNGAAFAYTLTQYDKTYGTLDPFVLVPMVAPQPQIYAASSPDLVGDREALERVLGSLGFQSGVDFAYESAGELAINENGDRLRLSAAGKVTFHAGEESRYAVSGQGETPTAAEAAETAWELLNRAVGPWKGEMGYVLSGVEATAEGWLVRFQARLGGVPVWTGETGEAAWFSVKGHRISDFSLNLRACAGTGLTATVPGERLAAAAMDSLPQAGGKLALRYSDNGQLELTAGWVAEE